MADQPQHREFTRGWKIILASSIGVGCGVSAVLFYTFGVFIVPLQDQFTWSRGDIQFAITLYSFGALSVLPIVGRLLDNYGARRIALLSTVIFATLFSCLSFVTSSIWTFYAILIATAVLSAGSMPITYTRIINTWFDKRRGIALGLMLAGTGVAATVLPRYASWLIENLGWRTAYPGLAVVTFAISFPVLFLLLRDYPHPQPSHNLSKQRPRTTNHQALHGFNLRTSMSSYKFWVLAFGLLCTSFALGGIIPNLVPMLTDMGYAPSVAAGYAGLLGVMVISGRLLVGVLLDYLWSPLVAFCVLTPTFISCLLLTIDGLGPAGVIVSVALVGLATGAEYDLIAYLVSRFFGMKHYGVVYGTQYMFFGIGFAVGPPVYGYGYDINSSYDPILYVTAAIMILAPATFLSLGSPPKRFDKKSSKER